MPFIPMNVLPSIFGFGVNKTSKILLPSLVNNFNLTITLRMICKRNLQLCATQFEQFTPKFAKENWISIRNDALRRSMKFANNSATFVAVNCVGSIPKYAASNKQSTPTSITMLFWNKWSPMMKSK